MADALDENWWEETDETKRDETTEKTYKKSPKRSTQVNHKQKQGQLETLNKKALKRSRESDAEERKDAKKKQSAVPEKKKKERKRITTESDEVLTRPGTAKDFNSIMTNALKDRLGEEALNDMLLDPETDFLPNNSESLKPSAYLKSALPTWRTTFKKSLFMKKSGSPCLLIITSSAIRAVDLNRQIKEFLDKKCKTAKLFAKHMKLEEQKTYLAKTNCQVGIGTPGRISQLIKQGALKLESLTGIVLDWNWRDQKLKRMSDIPEVRAELVTLVKDFLIEAVQGSACKLGLL